MICNLAQRRGAAPPRNPAGCLGMGGMRNGSGMRRSVVDSRRVRVDWIPSNHSLSLRMPASMFAVCSSPGHRRFDRKRRKIFTFRIVLHPCGPAAAGRPLAHPRSIRYPGFAVLAWLVGVVSPAAHAWSPVSLVPASALLFWPVVPLTLLALAALLWLWQRDRLLDCWEWLEDACDDIMRAFKRPAPFGHGRRSTARGLRFDTRNTGLSQSRRNLAMKNSRARASKPAPVMGFVQWILTLDSRLRRRHFELHDRDYLRAMLKADRDARSNHSDL
jgi:hypothetical protein